RHHPRMTSREVAKLSPDLWDWRLELAKGNRGALLETRDVVRDGEMRDELRRFAHPGDIGRFVVDHEGAGRREVWRQPVPVAQMWTDRPRSRGRIVVDLECARNAVVGRDDDRARAR